LPMPEARRQAPLEHSDKGPAAPNTRGSERSEISPWKL
jgi:hypothetical protein